MKTSQFEPSHVYSKWQSVELAFKMPLGAPTSHQVQAVSSSLLCSGEPWEVQPGPYHLHMKSG